MAKSTIRYKSDDQKEFIKTMSSLSGRFNTWEIWSDFITMFATALSNAVDKVHFEKREQNYLKIINKYNKTEQQVFPHLMALVTQALERDKNRDFLGELYMALNLGNHWKGQFFTPYCICAVMAQMNISNIEGQINENGFISVADCCCGAGALLVAFANEAEKQLAESECNWQNHILFAAQDIDMVAGLMCYIQLSLIGCAGYVKIGNSLTEPMTQGEFDYNLSVTDSNYWYTPMYFSDVWHYRRLWHLMDRMINLPVNCGDLQKTTIDLSITGKANQTDMSNSSPEPIAHELREEKNGQLSLL